MAYILSLDASTKNTGWAVFQDTKLIDYGCISDNSKNRLKRIKYQTKEIEKIVKKYNFKNIVMEEVRPPTDHMTNENTWKALMWLQASINLMLYDIGADVDIQYFYPSEWRKKCGIRNGKGVKRSQAKQYDIEFVENEYNINLHNNDDIADAIGIGHAYVNNLSNELNWE